jgi:starch synthase
LHEYQGNIMTKKKVLFVTQELFPYTENTLISELTRKIPGFATDEGFELRVLMPKFGLINERRHRLHEVVRLSGMNIIVDDEDYPLIIKVASLPGARLQVYFLDNEEFFKRKHMLHDQEGQSFDDNQERVVFFCKGVMETVKKFGWAPDIVHLHGQMTSLIPLYMKKAYRHDPVFSGAKILYSAYNDELGPSFNDRFLQIAAINDLEVEDLQVFQQQGHIDLNMGAFAFSDGILAGNEGSNELVSQYAGTANKPFRLGTDELEVCARTAVEFYKNILEE